MRCNDGLMQFHMQDLADRLWVHANLRKQEAVEVRMCCKIKRCPKRCKRSASPGQERYHQMTLP